MYEFNFYDEQTEEFVADFLLINVKAEDVIEVFGFPLQGNCTDVTETQLRRISLKEGRSFHLEGCTVSICEVKVECEEEKLNDRV